MTDPYRPQAPVAFPATGDEKTLQTLSTFHYVVAALLALFSCVFIAYIAIGVSMLVAPDGWATNGAHEQHGTPVPTGVGVFFVAMGGFAVLLGWTMAALTAFAGRCLTRRRRYTFCLVIAGLLCLWMPFGTILGVFTLVTMSKPPVRAQFEGQRA
jgi:hypothetical protein